MLIKPILTKITIYPIKSLDGIDLEKAQVTKGGCLLHDREFAIVDESGNFINGKSTPRIHRLRSAVNFEHKTISFCGPDEEQWKQYHFAKEKQAIEAFLSSFFEKKAFLLQDNTGRFMDVPDLSGVTIVSTSSLNEVGSWYAGMGLEETRKRFRTTLEIEGVAPFWEDNLFADQHSIVEFKIGEVTVHGMSPRARCIVPTRHPETGNVTRAFPKVFANKRASTLPSGSNLDLYGHYYYLTVDCLIPESEIGKNLIIGDELKITGKRLLVETG